MKASRLGILIFFLCTLVGVAISKFGSTPPPLAAVDAPAVVRDFPQRERTESLTPVSSGAGDMMKRWQERDKPRFVQRAECPLPLPAGIGAPEGQISLVILPGVDATYQEKVPGFTLLVVNRTGSEVLFLTCDSALFLDCEAMDESGNWRPIEDLPRTDCGNSYSGALLPDAHCWSLRVPKYDGPFRTKIRYRMQMEKTSVYSAEFEGSIDPGLFNIPPHPNRWVQR